MAAWLEAGSLVETMQEHADYVPFLAFEERVQARRELMATDNGAGLAEHERHQLPGEQEEPEGLA